MAGPARRILLVDDDETFRETLAGQLALYDDYETAGAGTAAEAFEILDGETWHAILLDVALPDMDGRDACRLIRRKGVHVPVILLTGLDGEADAVLGLDSGANDYVTKPFRIGVLLARLRAHLRQHELSEDASFPVGPYTFKPSAKLLRHHASGVEVVLSDKECAILKHLYRAGDAGVSCETLYSEIWAHNATLATHTLQTHVYRLRQKIEENPPEPAILVSVPGGYRLVR